MADFNEYLVTGANIQEIGASVQAAYQLLPADIRKRFHELRKRYLLHYGPVEYLRYLNNRTIGQILADPELEQRIPIASGERDGVRFELYDNPDNTGG